MKKIIKIIIDLLMIIILAIGIYYIYQFYSANNFDNFSRCELYLYQSQFTRDNNIKYSEKNSYKITSNEYNDAMFYQKIKVEKNTPYRVTCMVKTNNVKSENNISGSGAHISIDTTTERSIAVTGTTDWQQIEMIFNSKNREEVSIGFRLGGYLDNCTGEAWFSDFKIEQGYPENNTTWKFACFIFDSVEANIEGQNLKYTLNSENIKDMEDTIQRFQNTCSSLSDVKMTAICDNYEINTPITKLSYDEKFGYYVAPEDVEEQIKDIVNENDYDHIFIIFKLDDNEVKDWVGLRSNGLLWNRFF